jgi:hypothetical protein
MTDVIVPFTGWGRGTWGQLAFGEGSVTNAGATGVIGSVTVVAEANIPVTGFRGYSVCWIRSCSSSSKRKRHRGFCRWGRWFCCCNRDS